MAGDADLPEEHGAPGVEQDLLARAAELAEDAEDRPHRDAFEGHHDDLHEADRGGDPGCEEEDHLREGRVDCGGVVAAVDVVEDGLVRGTEGGECGVAGDVAAGRDAGVLDDAIPDVAVDVAREEGRRDERDDAACDRDGEDEAEGPAVGWLREDEGAGGGVDEDGPAGDAGEADPVVGVLADEQEGEEDGGEAEEGQN